MAIFIIKSKKYSGYFEWLLHWGTKLSLLFIVCEDNIMASRLIQRSGFIHFVAGTIVWAKLCEMSSKTCVPPPPPPPPARPSYSSCIFYWRCCDSRQVNLGIINFGSLSCSFMLASIAWWMRTIFNKTSFNGHGRSRSPITSHSSWCEEKINCWLSQDFSFGIRSDGLITIKIGRSSVCHLDPVQTRSLHMRSISCDAQAVNPKMHGPLTRYSILRVAHAPGMPGTFSPPPNSIETVR